MKTPRPENEDHPADTRRFDVAVFNRTTRIITSIAARNVARWNGRDDGRFSAERMKALAEDDTNRHFGVIILPAGKFHLGDRVPETP